MSHAVIGMFDTAAAATAAQAKLIAAGIPASAIRITGSGAVSSSSGTTTQAVSSTGTEDKGFWSSVKEMFGGDEEGSEVHQHLSYYNEGNRRGGSILTVEATEAQTDRVADILTAAGAVDVDGKSAEWQASGWKAPVATTASATTAKAAVGAAAGKIDLVKEDLAVGKRVVNRGGVRIVKRIIERPFEQNVSLREEHVSVDRRTVDRALTGGELTDAFKEGTVEMTESGEEVVASKTARVVGEVVLGKTATERTEKVADTLRETDVQVEQLPGQTTSSTTTTSKTVTEGGTGTTRTTKSNA